ncbi:MAG: VOC family protein [Dehalococcoidia bacterium]|nr:VOC family protein [Dehalococcoidia bacterium]
MGTPYVEGLGWFVRRAPDPEPVIAFFREVVGLPVIRETGRSTMFWAGETTVFEVGYGGQPNPPYTDRAQAPVTPIWRCANIQATIDRLTAHGVTFINDFTRDHNRLAYFLDPAGNVTGLQERFPSSPRPQDIEARRRWEAGPRQLPGVDPLPPDLQHLGWVVYRVPRPRAEIAFLTDAFGLAIGHDYGEHGALLELDPVTLWEISAGGGPPAPITDVHDLNNCAILRVRNFDALITRLRAREVRFVQEPLTFATGRIAFIVDAEGQVTGIQERLATSDRVEDREARRRQVSPRRET